MRLQKQVHETTIHKCHHAEAILELQQKIEMFKTEERVRVAEI